MHIQTTTAKQGVIYYGGLVHVVGKAEKNKESANMLITLPACSDQYRTMHQQRVIRLRVFAACWLSDSTGENGVEISKEKRTYLNRKSISKTRLVSSTLT